jgi:RNA polymerase sigma factor (sigma-70 family)
MIDDAELLRQYAAERSETAFTEFVRRHVDFVYATALRSVSGDAHRAADVSQYVFAEAARKAAALAKHGALKGWLYTTARYASANIVRAELRRQLHEREAQTMHELTHQAAQGTADELRPVIDHALGALSERDRAAVFMRFFEGREYPEIGARFSVTADAARLRIERALEKMRIALSHRGVASTTAALIGTLTTQAAVVAPAGFAGAVATTALATGTASSGVITFLSFMSMTKLQAGLVGALALVGILGTVIQQQAHAKLQDEFAAARQENERLPHLRSENRRLAEASTGGNEVNRAELAQLRAEAESLQQKLAAAVRANPPPALAPGMVPLAAWKNAGQATPGAAFETLQWAKSAIDFATLGRMMDLPAADRTKAREVFEQLSDAVRSKLGLTTPEEMLGLVCAMNDELAGARVTLGTPQGSEEMTLRAQVQRADGRIDRREFLFRRHGDAWLWVVPQNELRHGLNEISRGFLGRAVFEGEK